MAAKTNLGDELELDKFSESECKFSSHLQMTMIMHRVGLKWIPLMIMISGMFEEDFEVENYLDGNPNL